MPPRRCLPCLKCRVGRGAARGGHSKQSSRLASWLMDEGFEFSVYRRVGIDAKPGRRKTTLGSHSETMVEWRFKTWGGVRVTKKFTKVRQECK